MHEIYLDDISHMYLLINTYSCREELSDFYFIYMQMDVF